MKMNINTYIDHTLLHPTATEADIKSLCEEAITYQFKSVCIQPSYVSDAYQLLKASSVKVCTVIGFPHGANTTEGKIFEAKQAILDGASEIDYVVNLGHVKNKRFDLVEAEMAAFAKLKISQDHLVIKIILETCYLDNKEISELCQLAKEHRIDFVKTSTGFGTGGATLEHVRLMKQEVADVIAVKASGGVRTYEDAMQMIEAGAGRIGTSNGIAIVKKTSSQSEGY